MEANKQKSLDEALLQIQKKYGKGAVLKMGERPDVSVSVIPTGSFNLDYQLGIGGLPRGRVVEIYGPESSGKTTLTLHCIAECQKAGGACAFIDVEHAIDPEYSKKLGVNIDELYLSQPDSGEQALEIAESLARSGSIDLIVIDSVSALVPKAEIDGDMGDSHVGLQARLMSQALRKLTPVISNTNCCVVFINQLREKVGVMFGSPETTSGGRALKFYSSIRLDIRRIETVKSGGEAVANKVRVKIVKNKMAPPFKEAEFDIIFGEGIDNLGEVVDIAADKNVIQKSGAWYAYGETKIGQGRDKTKEFLKSNPEMFAEIKTKLMELLFPEKPEDTEKPVKPEKK